jgi:hypothetical protein
VRVVFCRDAGRLGPLGIDCAGAIYHVLSRKDRREPICLSDVGRNYFWRPEVPKKGSVPSEEQEGSVLQFRQFGLDGGSDDVIRFMPRTAR